MMGKRTNSDARNGECGRVDVLARGLSKRQRIQLCEGRAHTVFCACRMPAKSECLP